ncbi:hypothetical protein MUK42_33380, partial [Musa troglodytarum]
HFVFRRPRNENRERRRGRLDRLSRLAFRKASILTVAHALFAEMTRHGDAKRVRRICIRLCARNNFGFEVFVGLGFE